MRRSTQVLCSHHPYPYLYRYMEKSNHLASASFPVNSELPVFRALQVSFEPFALRRPLKLFGAALGMPIGAVATPDPDFFVQLVEGIGYQQLLRYATGRHYKNFENFVRKRNRTTPTTKRILLAKLGVDEPTLDLLAHGRPDGSLLPAGTEIFAAIEGMFVRLYGSATIGRVPCRCCGGDLLDDTDAWWKAQPLQLEAGAYRFIDRLLKATVGAIALMAILNLEPRIDLACVRRLAAPDCHPIGHWIDMVRSARGVTYDWELTVGRNTTGVPFGPEANGRIRKWRCGQDLLPKLKALTMMDGLPDTKTLRQALLAARTLALALDVVQAAADQPSAPGRELAQKLVDARLAQIESNLRVGLTALARNARSRA